MEKITLHYINGNDTARYDIFQNVTEQALTSFQPNVTCSPPEIPDPEKSRVKTVIFEGSKIIAASLASALHPLPQTLHMVSKTI